MHETLGKRARAYNKATLVCSAESPASSWFYRFLSKLGLGYVGQAVFTEKATFLSMSEEFLPLRPTGQNIFTIKVITRHGIAHIEVSEHEYRARQAIWRQSFDEQNPHKSRQAGSMQVAYQLDCWRPNLIKAKFVVC